MNRGIMNVRVNVPRDPSAGTVVTIVRVTDQRHFEAAPRDASIPSLQGNEITDKALTSRAIARKRGGTGKALGDILLPQGRTVEDLVKEALTRSFRDAGYRVIDQAAASKEKAIPLEADIEQFWSWCTPGFWIFSLQFEARVKIKGNVSVFKNGEMVRGYVRVHAPGVSNRTWMHTINKGIDAFVREVKTCLASR
jgi:hypothetical protein